MDRVFSLDEEARALFLQSLLQSVGCTYVCIWSYYPHPMNCLVFKDGLYNEQNDQARRLFNDYQQYIYSLDNGYVPGLAFKDGLPYLEINELDLLRRVSNETQRQFYQEARIEVAAFMGCRSGEIEMGYSSPPQINMQMEMRRWFPDDFYLRSQSQPRELPHAPEQNRPSSSSSSLRSLSMGSPPPEYPSLVFNIPSSSSNIPSSSSNIPESLKEAATEQQTKPTSTAIIPHPQQQQTMQPYHGLRHLQFPNPQRDDAAMTRAILAVISSPSSASSSYQPQQNPPRNYRGAFTTYIPSLAPKAQVKSSSVRKNLLKRAISFLASMRLKRFEEQMQGSRPKPTTTQLTHMISERKRREKLNESFQALRSLLPPGSKRDKASVLSSTRDYLHALKGEVLELKQKNKLLESRVSPAREAGEEVGGGSTSSSSERVEIQVTQAAASTSEGEGIELRVTVRVDCNMMDLVIRILEFLKKVGMGLVSVEADKQVQQQTSPLNRVVIRLNTQGSQWDESTFREAIARIVADVTRPYH